MSDTTDELVALLNSLLDFKVGEDDSIAFTALINNKRVRYPVNQIRLTINALCGYQRPHLILEDTAKGFGVDPMAYYPTSAKFTFHSKAQELEVKKGKNHFLLSDFKRIEMD